MGLNSTPRTWVASEVVTAALMNTEVRDALTGIQAAWSSYTPTLTAVTTNPTLGTGNTAFGNFLQIGKLVVCVGQIAVGTTGWNAGSGQYRFSLPVAADTTGATSKRIGIATAAGTSSGVGGYAYLATSTALSIYYYSSVPSGGGTLNSAAPAAQLAGSVYDWLCVYEAA